MTFSAYTQQHEVHCTTVDDIDGMGQEQYPHQMTLYDIYGCCRWQQPDGDIEVVEETRWMPGRMGIRYSPIAMSTRIESANHMHHVGQQCKEEGKDGRHFRCRHFKSSFFMRESNTLVPLWNGHLGWPPGTGAKAYLVHANQPDSRIGLGFCFLSRQMRI